MEERQAIARLRQGDIGGLEALVRQHQVRAVRTVYLITRDRPLAEDIVQVAFLRVHERIHQFDPERPFAPWFFKSLVNDALKALQRQRRQISLETDLPDTDLTLADLLPSTTGDPADEAERAELRDKVWAALGQLPPEQRAAVILRYYLGFNEAEAAEQMKVAQGTIKWRLHAARERLSGLLRPFAQTGRKG